MSYQMRLHTVLLFHLKNIIANLHKREKLNKSKDGLIRTQIFKNQYTLEKKNLNDTCAIAISLPHSNRVAP